MAALLPHCKRSTLLLDGLRTHLLHTAVPGGALGSSVDGFRFSTTPVLDMAAATVLSLSPRLVRPTTAATSLVDALLLCTAVPKVLDVAPDTSSFRGMDMERNCWMTGLNAIAWHMV